MTRRKRLQNLLEELAREYRGAPVEEWNYPHRDEFTRHYRRVGVELCHGHWHTFSRYGCQSDPHVTKHASREEARAYALRLLGVS